MFAGAPVCWASSVAPRGARTAEHSIVVVSKFIRFDAGTLHFYEGSDGENTIDV